MAGSRALWQDQTAPPLTAKERAENAKQAKKPGMMLDEVPGDEGSTVGTIRARKKAMKEAIESQTE